MDKQDLTNYSENELSLHVFNCESLYSMRNDSDLIETLSEIFIFSTDQENVLTNDLIEDSNEKFDYDNPTRAQHDSELH